ncbi:DUF2285 domain-containing protein [Rhizorhabdus dicambivorans]|uniref:DUF2285 domain-containing protein n=1 Tax=Rhizorhabdus dicambivorans TaxID=1850238 RepID=UPI0009F28FF6|nr:DUF2285 domain-containing protein [Rhizorhabdus dicambivorans]ATE65238.1 DUF2285 domain-containing protein [Rhizorhabdus dicambivorans]
MAGVPHRIRPDASDYEHLASVDVSGLAWEWLRRDPAYCQMEPARRWSTPEGVTVIEAAPLAVVARWGCLHIGDPHLRSSDCSMLWGARMDPSVLRVDAVPLHASDEATSFALRRWSSRATVVKQPTGGENLLLRDGLHSLRLDIMSGSLLDGPVALRFDIHRADSVDPMIDTLRRFLHFQRTGAIPPQRRSRVRHHQRAILALRVHDALVQGASIRDVGITLFGIGRVEAEWEASGESLKSACRRLIALARSMVSGGYLSLLTRRSAMLARPE